MVLVILRKLILQTRVRTHPVGLDVWLSDLVGPFVYFYTSCVRSVKALARLRRCAGSPKPSLVAYMISTIISWAGSNGGHKSRQPAQRPAPPSPSEVNTMLDKTRMNNLTRPLILLPQSVGATLLQPDRTEQTQTYSYKIIKYVKKLCDLSTLKGWNHYFEVSSSDEKH